MSGRFFLALRIPSACISISWAKYLRATSKFSGVTSLGSCWANQSFIKSWRSFQSWGITMVFSPSSLSGDVLFFCAWSVAQCCFASEVSSLDLWYRTVSVINSSTFAAWPIFIVSCLTLLNSCWFTVFSCMNWASSRRGIGFTKYDIKSANSVIHGYILSAHSSPKYSWSSFWPSSIADLYRSRIPIRLMISDHLEYSLILPGIPFTSFRLATAAS